NGKARVDRTGSSGPVTFNGTQGKGAAGALNKAEQDLLESLVDDSADSLMELISSGNGFTLLGRRFPNGSGGFCDLYDVPEKPKTRNRPVAPKRYCFDSASGLLTYVTYSSDQSQGSVIRSQYSDWRTINGDRFPGRIVRTE